MYRHLFRNFVVWAAFLVIWCVVEYSYVHRGPASVSGADEILLPVFYCAVLFANRGLFANWKDSIRRWVAIAAVSLLVAVASWFVLAFPLVLFHLAIGGSL